MMAGRGVSSGSATPGWSGNCRWPGAFCSDSLARLVRQLPVAGGVLL
ncbi:MAG: hypothetical protein IJC73_01400 [Lentisphaeria bacterium]|nr:hypothetical protein [Lentisphaeria bacterium]